jgi:transposase
MDYHYHARLTIHRREELAKTLIQGRLSLKEAAAEFKLSRQSAAKWVARFRHQGPAGLRDRSSRPHHSPRRTGPELATRVEGLRRERWTGMRIAQSTALSRSTVSRILTRLRLNKMRMLDPAVPIVRYEHPAPGDLLHIDIKKLARIRKPGHRKTGNPQDETRGAGWEFLYVAIDDHSRIAFTAMLPDEKAISSSRFLRQAVAHFAQLGIAIRRVMTNNGPCFCSSLRPAASSRSSPSALASIPQRPTAKPSASSKPPFVSGPTPGAMRTPPIDSVISRPGSTSTTGIDLIPASTKNHQKPPISRSGLDINNLLTHHT